MNSSSYNSDKQIKCTVCVYCILTICIYCMFVYLTEIKLVFLVSGNVRPTISALQTTTKGCVAMSM